MPAYKFERYTAGGRLVESFWRDSETHMACARPAPPPPPPEPERICAHCGEVNRSHGYGEYCSRRCTDWGIQLQVIRANYNPEGRTHRERFADAHRVLTMHGEVMLARANREARERGR
jgi:hypothetical protein